LKALFTRAHGKDAADELAAALRDVVREMQTDPIEFGDPWHQTLLHGGRIYHRIIHHRAIRYAVFKREKVVFVLNVQPHGDRWR
jgi:hypothetical protein